MWKRIKWYWDELYEAIFLVKFKQSELDRSLRERKWRDQEADEAIRINREEIAHKAKAKAHKAKAKSVMMAAFRDIDPQLSYAIKCTLTYLEAK